MGGDLNLKKSWHPGLVKNQTRVWKEEKSALEERKAIEKLRKEREEERQIEELQRLQEASGGKVATKRVDWMYNGPSADGAGVAEEREAFLLGKRRVDTILLRSDPSTQALSKNAPLSVDALTAQPMPGDLASKIAQDPLLVIQKQQMELNLQRARDAAKQAKLEGKKDRRHDKSDRKHDRRSDRRDDYKEDRYRRRSRSRSPRRSNYRHRDERRSERREHKLEYRRSHSPRHQRPRHRSPVRDDDRPKKRESDGPTKEEKLAQMQANAMSLEEQRNERVRLREMEDAAEEARHKQSKDGTQRFMAKQYRLADNMDLGDVMARGKQGHRGSTE